MSDFDDDDFQFVMSESDDVDLHQPDSGNFQSTIQPNIPHIDSNTMVNKNMTMKIWRVLVQILYYRNDLADTIKPFFVNLKKENINDKKYIPLLKTFSKNQLKVLYENGIMINLKEGQNQSSSQSTSDNPKNDLEEIISGDKVEILDKFIQKNGIKTVNTITKAFKEVEEMKIPIIQFCIMNKAIECFKFLLINGFDDPNKTMEEQNPECFYDYDIHKRIEIKRYEWDCMATAIYFGNKEIIKILEVRGIEKGKNPTHIEAAILSYRNMIAKEIIWDLNENKEQIQNFLNLSIIASAKSNNINGVEYLMTNGADINMHNKHLNAT